MAHLKPQEIVERAEEFWHYAELAASDNAFNVAAICSYVALFWAARAALAYEGFDRPTWEHSELRSKFTHELIQTRNRYPKQFGTWLVNAYTLRNAAQYHLADPKTKEVKRMVKHAKEFIDKIHEVLSK